MGRNGHDPHARLGDVLVGVILKGGRSAALTGYNKELATLWQTSFAAIVAGRRPAAGATPTATRPIAAGTRSG